MVGKARGHVTDPVRAFTWSPLLWEKNMARFDENAPVNAETEFLDTYLGEENWTRAELSTMNQEVDGIADQACLDMRAELRSDLPDSIFDQYKSNAKEQFKQIKSKKNTVLSYEKWLRIVNLYYHYAHANSGSHGKRPSLKSEFITSKPGKVQFYRLAEILAKMQCGDGSYYAQGSVKTFIGALFKAIFLKSNREIKLSENAMIRASVKVMFSNSKAKGLPKFTEAIPTAYMKAVANFLRKKKGTLGLVWRVFLGVHGFGSLRANSEDFQLLWGDFCEVVENGKRTVHCKTVLNAKRGDNETSLQEKKFVIPSPWDEDVIELKNMMQNQFGYDDAEMDKIHVFCKFNKHTDVFDAFSPLKMGQLGSKMWKDILIACHNDADFIAAILAAGLDPKRMFTGAHKIRATALTILIKHGFGDSAVKSASGHKSGSSLQHYVCNNMESLAEFATVIADKLNTTDETVLAPGLSIAESVDLLRPTSSTTSALVSTSVSTPRSTAAPTNQVNSRPNNLAVPRQMPVPVRRVTYPSSPTNNRSLAAIGEEHARRLAAAGIPHPLDALQNTSIVDDFEFDEAEYEQRRRNPNEYFFDLNAAASTDDDLEGYTTASEEPVLDDESSDFDNTSDFEGISEQISKISVADTKGEKRKRSDSTPEPRYPKRSNRNKRE